MRTRGSSGSMRLRLVNTGRQSVEDFTLTFSTIVQLAPDPPARLIERTSGCHVVAPPAGYVLAPGEVWELTAACGHRPRHANDGPGGAFVTLADGSVVPVATATTRRIEVGEVPAVTYRAAGEVASAALASVAARDARLHPDRAAVLSPTGEQVVSASIRDDLGADAFHLLSDTAGCSAIAGSASALEQALTRLVRAARAGSGVPAGEHVAVHGWRGLHIDLARQFLPPVDVSWLVDVAAWHGLNRLHLHLTDDEAWRFPVPGYDALTEVGAWRGHGLAVPPLLGSGPAPYGGCYSPADIAAWHERAAASGVVIVPELDVPGHSHAALAAVPELVDPGDTTGAVSVQHFVDDVLNPGVAATWLFLEAAFGALADAFPSPWLHLGGDEVAGGAWAASPAAQRWAAARDISGSHAIGLAFVRELTGLVRRTTERDVGVWEEGAGALEPGDGYVLGWTSAAACRELAAAGHTVVAAPAETMYLDMATTADWYEPGAGWAGTTSVADIESADLTAGWTPDERSRLLGVQACVWTEHVPDRPALERRLFPRLTALADTWWPWPPGGGF